MDSTIDGRLTTYIFPSRLLSTLHLLCSAFSSRCEKLNLLSSANQRPVYSTCECKRISHFILPPIEQYTFPILPEIQALYSFETSLYGYHVPFEPLLDPKSRLMTSRDLLSQYQPRKRFERLLRARSAPNPLSRLISNACTPP
jgi:hypothetical protein